MIEAEETDQALWLLVSLGSDRAAFEQLYRRYMRVLYAAIYKWVEDTAEAEDILQEVFLDIWEKRASIDIQHKIFPYLYSIARFKIFDYLRKKKLTGRQLQAWHALTNTATEETAAFETSEKQQQEEQVLQQIELLPAQMRRVYILSFIQGKSISEIAGILTVSPNTVKNHLQKLRRRFRNVAVRITTIFFSLHFLYCSRVHETPRCNHTFSPASSMLSKY